MKRLSHAHWRVQTRSEHGWVTRCWTTLLTGAIAAAEGYKDDAGVPARVVLADQIYYSTEARNAREVEESRAGTPSRG